LIRQQATPTTFSYLPEGAPPWPSAASQSLPYASVPAPAYSRPTLHRKAEPRKRGRSARGALAVAAVLVLAPLVGVAITLGSLFFNGYSFGNVAKLGGAAATNNAASTPAARKASTPTVAPKTNQLPKPTSFHKTSSPDLNITLQYPGTWIADAPKKSDTATQENIHPQPQEQIGIRFTVVHFSNSVSASVTNADQINQGNLQQLASLQGVNNLQLVQGSTSPPTIGGAQWAEQDAVFSDNNGNSIRFVTISVQRNKSYYNIFFFSPDVYYAEAMQKYLQPMLDSIQFLS
jgi:hypothetical protein